MYTFILKPGNILYNPNTYMHAANPRISNQLGRKLYFRDMNCRRIFVIGTWRKVSRGN